MNSLAEPDGLANVMSHEEDREVGFYPKSLQLIVKDVPRYGVKRTERFVHQKDTSLLRERTCNSYALPHTTRKLVRTTVSKVLEMYEAKELVNSGLPRSTAHSAQAQCEFDVVPGRKPREQGCLLEKERRLSFDLDRPVLGLVQPRDQVEERCLPAPRRSHEAAQLALGNVQRQAVEGKGMRTGRSVNLRYVGYDDSIGARSVFRERACGQPFVSGTVKSTESVDIVA